MTNFPPTPEQSAALEKLLANSQWEDGCLVWLGSRDRYGYGSVRWEGRTFLVHRLGFFCHTGKHAELNVLHHCDNPACWAKEHLFKGTQQDNIDDMINKGRHSYGRGYYRVLTDSQVSELKLLSLDGWSQRRLALRYNIAQSSVGNYLRRLS